jgi:hypothetical protein
MLALLCTREIEHLSAVATLLALTVHLLLTVVCTRNQQHV